MSGNRKLYKETCTLHNILLLPSLFYRPLNTHLYNLLGRGLGGLGRLPVLLLRGRGGGLLGEGDHHRLNLHTAISSNIMYKVDQGVSLLLI